MTLLMEYPSYTHFNIYYCGSSKKFDVCLFVSCVSLIQPRIAAQCCWWSHVIYTHTLRYLHLCILVCLYKHYYGICTIALLHWMSYYGTSSHNWSFISLIIKYIRVMHLFTVYDDEFWRHVTVTWYHFLIY